jgi:hypothetical protein
MRFSTLTTIVAALAGFTAAYTQPQGNAPSGNPTSEPALGEIVPAGAAFDIKWKVRHPMHSVPNPYILMRSHSQPPLALSPSSFSAALPTTSSPSTPSSSASRTAASTRGPPRPISSPTRPATASRSSATLLASTSTLPSSALPTALSPLSRRPPQLLTEPQPP